MRTGYLIGINQDKNGFHGRYGYNKNIKVGDTFFGVGVRGGPYDLDNFLENNKEFVELIKRFPEVGNTVHFENIKAHMLQPVILKRIK